MFCSIHRLFVYLRMQMSTSKQQKIEQNTEIILIAGMPSSQALLGFLITAPPSVCVPDVIGVLAVWISIQKKKLQMDSCWDVGRDPQATPRLFAATSLVSACPHAHPLGSVLTHIEAASLVSLIATPRRPRAPLFATLCCPVQQT